MAGPDYPLMPNEDPYPASALRKTKWGEFRQLSDGSWQTTWTLILCDNHTREAVAVHHNESIGFTSSVHFLGMRNAELQVLTREQPMSAVNYPATYMSFRIVNDELAEIDTIQGLPRNWYPPFRDRI